MSPSNPSALALFDRELLERGVLTLVGIDEAGRGPLAGPVIAAAVQVQEDRFIERIDDSKKLSARQRNLAYHEIMTRCKVSLAFVEHEVIDRDNIFRATQQAMTKAFHGLGVDADLVLVDGTASLDLGCEVRRLPGADALSLSVACASIVAKVTRDRLMQCYDAQYPSYGFYRHKGYGTREHLEALQQHGPCPIHRKSFSPVLNAPQPTPAAF